MPSPAPAAPAAPAGPVEIPLHALLPKLGPAIQNFLERPARPGELLRIPCERIRAQLAAGSVKLSVSELRQLSPEGIFKTGDSDEQFEIPLGEILPRLKPEHLARRANQQKVAVSDEIGNVFGANGSQVRIVMDNKPAAGKAAIPSSIPTSIPAPAAVKMAPSQPAGAVNTTPQPIAASRLDAALAGGKKRGEKIFTLPLMDVVTHWTNAGKEDLASMYRHTLEIPVEMVESGLKRGKLAFPWRQFRQFVKVGAGGSLPSLPDEQEVELPLAIVAPRFMEDFGFSKPKKKIDVGTDIPDVFDIKRDAASGAPVISTPTPVSIAAPAAPAPAPAKPAPATTTPLRAAPAPISMPAARTAAPAPIAMPTAPMAAGPARFAKPAGETPSTSFITKPMLDFGDIFGQPEKKSWSLQEVVQKCAGLSGVAGALIATSDGLLVASAWPGEVKSEAVAAFVPQTYNRMLQYSKELKLADATNFTFMADTVPVQIFKSGSSFLTVLGRAGENLPRTQLSAVAQRLSQNSPR